ncbi:MAG: hypothetical protein IPJ21_03805 [Sterolibacteriaceae bacterium]|nr:hypothetical protein [Sterolibacteriaceae bacterium]MBK9086781.1 hypothetical protein [Sterolibacteriaceae bacterium]
MIGRRFVPVGALNNQWNLILWACHPCNRKKSDLEDDIAAITLHLHTAGLPQMSDSRAQAESQRRSHKSGSRKTGKPVSQSSAKLSFKAPLGLNATIEGHFTAPPQLDDARAYELARLQMVGFFYFLTFDRTKQVGHYWPGEFYPVHGAHRSDWGNPIHVAFTKQIADWDYRLILNTADGYYRALIRRHPTKDSWAWAVEWNSAYRLVGYFGERATAQGLFDELPPIAARTIVKASDGGTLRIRTEQPLAESDDTLFS